MGANQTTTITGFHYCDATSKSLKTILPIDEYEQKPLVSLNEAVQPLIPLIPNISQQAWAAQQIVEYSRATDSTSIEESAAIRLYTMDWGENKPLHVVLTTYLCSEQNADNQNKLEPFLLYLKLFTAGISHLSSHSGTVYRGINMNFSTRFINKKTIVCCSFLTCTTSLNTPKFEAFLNERGPRTMFIIDTISGKNIREHAANYNENEILLLPGTQFVVVKHEEVDNLHRIFLKETGSSFFLLHTATIPKNVSEASSTNNSIYASAAIEPIATDELTTNIKDQHLELFSLIWLDNNPSKWISNTTEQQLRSIINDFQRFQDVEQCQKYIQQRSENDRIVIVVSGRLGQEIVPSIHKLRQVISIYVYCINKEINEEWANRFVKVKGVVVRLNELVSCIQSDHEINKMVEEPWSIYTYKTKINANESTTSINGQFIFFQVLMNCLLRVKYTETDKKELIKWCKHQYQNTMEEMNNIYFFEKEYSPDKALWWYTKETFVYKTLNVALRKQNIHMIFLFREFISDIQRQSKDCSVKHAVQVYRGQRISTDELKTLESLRGQFISVKSFFSTSMIDNKARDFLNLSESSETTLPVLFEIHADPEKVSTQQFADVSAYSKFFAEKEILFMPGSIFRLESIDRGLPGEISIIRMTLCSVTEHDFNNMIGFVKQQYEDEEITLRTLGKILWDMGERDLAEKYFGRLINQLSFNDILLVELYKDIAKLQSQAGKLDKSLEWHQKALAIKNRHSQTSQLNIDAASKSVENNSEVIDSQIIDDLNIEQQKLSKSAVQMIETATANEPTNIVKTSNIQQEKDLTFNVPSNDTVHPACQFRTDKNWLNCQFHINNNSIIRPDEIENIMDEPNDSIDENVLNRIQGSMIGLALGDALGALAKGRSHQYLVHYPVTDLQCGGTWNLVKGQFTDNTSMALCLATSLIARRSFILYDQLVRYKWWFRLGYMSSTYQCFAIGESMKQSLYEFERRQEQYANEWGIPMEDIDYLSEPERLRQFNISCVEKEVTDNKALVRLAPVPLFFYRFPQAAIIYSGQSGQVTHGDSKVYDACRYYGSLIVAALHGYTKEQILDNEFYSKHKFWFNNIELDPSIESVAKGSYKKNGYDDGIRGTDNIVNALEAALWVFWSDEDSFEKGALAAVNLGDDTDAIASIYGQLAGAYYGYQRLPQHWLKYVYAKKFMEKLSTWIAYEGECCQKRHEAFAAQFIANKN